MTTVTIGRRAADTHTGLEDITLTQWLPNSVGGAGTVVNVAAKSGTDAKRAIFRITGLSNIPTNALVTAASLNLYRVNGATGGARNYNVHKLLKLPNEANATWNNQTTATPWGTAGANGDGVDADLTNIIATGTLPTGAGSAMVIDGVVSPAFLTLVRGWIAGTIPNYGILIKIVDEEVYTTGDFDIGAGERGTDAQRPYLSVTYNIPTPPDITVNDVAVNNLSGTATFTVTFSASYSSDITINCATANNTAIAGADYTATSVTPLTIPAGQTTGTVTVPIIP